MPLSRPSAMTAVAPASRSARASSTHVAGGQDRRRFLEPDLGDDGEPTAAARRMSAALASAPSRPRPSLTSTWTGTRSAAAHSRHASARPGRAAISSSVPPGQATTSVPAQQRELGVERRVEVGAPPAELPHVDERRRRVEDGVRTSGSGRPPSITAGDAPRAWLAGAVWQARNAGRWHRSRIVDGHHYRSTMVRHAAATGRLAEPPSRSAPRAGGPRPTSASCGEVFGPGDWLRGPVTTARSCGRRRGGRRLRRGDPARVRRAGPYGAGIAAVLTNVNDVAAMGAIPLAIVDTIVGDDSDLSDRCSRGCASRPSSTTCPSSAAT